MLRNERVAPRLVKSTTDSDEPSLLKPKSEKEDPSRA
jgi:hypothetical protein